MRRDFAVTISNVKIRPVLPLDLPGLSALLAETWHTTYDAIYGADRVTEITRRWHSIAALAAGLDQPQSMNLVAEVDGGLVGTACFSWTEDAAKLHRLYVLPAAQGLGIGGRLLDRVIVELRRQPAVSNITLEVEPLNSAAIGFYRRHDFDDAGRTGDCGGGGDRIPALIMRRKLRASGPQ